MSKKESRVKDLSIAGFSSCAIKTAKAPLERVRLLLQCQNEVILQGRLNESYKGIFDCVRRTLANEGLRSMWRGNLASCVGFFPAQVSMLVCNDYVKNFFRGNSTDPQHVRYYRSILSGSITGMLAMVASYPFAYAQTRLVCDVKQQKNSGYRFSGIMDTMAQTYSKVGTVGLYRGFIVSYFRIVVYRSCYFGFYDVFKPTVLGPLPDAFSSFVFSYGVIVAASLVSYPLDTLRRRLMVASFEDVRYKGSLHCLFKIATTEGILALFNGFSAQLITGIASSIVLVAYDTYIQPHLKFK